MDIAEIAGNAVIAENEKHLELRTETWTKGHKDHSGIAATIKVVYRRIGVFGRFTRPYWFHAEDAEER